MGLLLFCQRLVKKKRPAPPHRQRGFNLEVALTYEKDPIFERIYTKFFSGKFKILSKKFLQHPSRDFYKYRMHSGIV